MKRTISFIIAVMMLAACFAFTGCAKEEEAATIKIGMQGPYTGSTAVYGLAVQTGARLYIDQLNAAGGINGKQIELVYYDNKGDDAEAVNAFTRLVDEGITAFIGDVLTGNTLAVVAEAYPINMPMITASATQLKLPSAQRTAPFTRTSSAPASSIPSRAKRWLLMQAKSSVSRPLPLSH